MTGLSRIAQSIRKDCFTIDINIFFITKMILLNITKMFQEVLRLSHDRSLNKYASIDEEDDFQVTLYHSVNSEALFQNGFNIFLTVK